MSLPRAVIIRTVAALLAAAPACSLVVDDVIEQCATDADCGEKGEGFERSVCREGVCQGAPPPNGAANDWSCVGRRPTAGPPAPEVKVGLRFADATSGAPVVGLSVTPCGRFDVACAEPLAAPALTGADGRAEVRVSTASTMPGIAGFAGYFLLSGEGRERILLAYHPPLAEDVEFSSLLIKVEQFAQIAALSGVSLDPGRGNAIFASEDCRGAPGAGVVLRLDGADPLAKIFYSDAGSPSTTATATDAGGLSFGTNLPPGYGALSAVQAAAGELARFSVLAQPGALSVAVVRPDR